MKKLIAIGAGVIALLTAPAMADKPLDIARDLSTVKTTAIQAIQAAQKIFPGQTYDVDLENTFIGHYWEIKIFTTDQRLIEAFVDAQNGEVVAADETAIINGKKKKTRNRVENGIPVQQ